MAGIALCLAGCAGGPTIPAEPLGPVPAQWRAVEVIAPTAPPPPRSRASVSGNLTLREAVNQAVAFSPSVKAAYEEIGAKHGEALQASFRLNPSFDFTLDNIPNSGGIAKDEANESLQLTDTLELGDKRLKRLAAADLESSLAAWDFEAARLQAATIAADAYVDVVASQERLAILEQFVTVSEKTRAAVETRVKAGRASPIEQDRAAVTVAQARAAHTSERARLAAARAKLAILWGEQSPAFSHAAGRLGRDRNAPSIDQVQHFLGGNPTLARWADTVGHRYAVLEVERSKAIPNVTFGAGYRHFNQDDSNGFIASVSVPLPLFDRNEGNIAAAERRVAKAQFDAEAARTQLTSLLIEALGALAAADAQARAIESQVLPAAESAFDKTRTGYEQGKFDLLNVLDTQRTLFEARRDLVAARAEYEKARVQVEALIGRDLSHL